MSTWCIFGLPAELTRHEAKSQFHWMEQENNKNKSSQQSPDIHWLRPVSGHRIIITDCDFSGLAWILIFLGAALRFVGVASVMADRKGEGWSQLWGHGGHTPEQSQPLIRCQSAQGSVYLLSRCIPVIVIWVEADYTQRQGWMLDRLTLTMTNWHIVREEGDNI